MECIEMKRFDKSGFSPVVCFEQWRVALLNTCNNYRVENLDNLQRHNETDEVFVLLSGECTLILSPEEQPQTIFGVRLRPGVVYNVKKGAWHTHILGENTQVLVVENDSTSLANSPRAALPCKVDLNTLTYREEITSL